MWLCSLFGGLLGILRSRDWEALDYKQSNEQSKEMPVAVEAFHWALKYCRVVQTIQTPARQLKNILRYFIIIRRRLWHPTSQFRRPRFASTFCAATDSNFNPASRTELSPPLQKRFMMSDNRRSISQNEISINLQVKLLSEF